MGFLDSFRRKKSAKKKQPEYATTYRSRELSNKGLSLVQSGKLDEGIALLEQAIELDPTNATAHINLGFAYAKKGLLDQAIAEYKRAIELNPKDPDSYYQLGQVHLFKMTQRYEFDIIRLHSLVGERRLDLTRIVNTYRQLLSLAQVHVLL